MKIYNIKHAIVVSLLFLTTLATKAQSSLNEIPASGPTPEVKLQSPKQFNLENGLRVLVVENHKLPRVVVALAIDNPPKLLKESKGAEAIISNMLGTGTHKYTKDQFNGKIDQMGASMSFSYKGTNASMLSKYFPEVLGLMADAIINPKFSEEEFQGAKKLVLNQLLSGEKAASSIASKAKKALLYGKSHPYGELTSEENINNLSLNEIKELYKKQYLPNNAYLVIMGDVNVSEVKKQVSKRFSNWKAEKITKEEFSLNTLEGFQINVVDVPSASQTEVSVIKKMTIKLTDDDYFPLLLANQILGGGSTGRLYKNIRENKGYSYGAYASIDIDQYVSSFDAFASVRTEVAHKAIEEFINELQRIQETQVSTNELALAKATITGDFVINSQNPGTIATLTLSKIINKLPNDFYKDYLQKVTAVTAADIQRVAKKYYNTKNTRIVVTGNAKELYEGLKTLQMPIVFFDKDANQIEAPLTNKSVPKGITAKQIISDYFDAIGGIEKVKEVTSVTQELIADFQGQQLKATVKAKAPNMSYNALEVTGMGTVYKQVFDGTTGYVEQMGQKAPLPNEAITALKTKKIFDELNFYENKECKVELVSIAYIDKKEAYEIAVTTPQNKKTFYYYDVKSKLKLLKKELEHDTNGEFIASNTGYDNYETIKGIKFPKTLMLPISGTQVLFKATSITVNEPIANKVFQ